ncbi:PWWP domain-containing protein 2B [Pelobates fuscus]|uniref:PWWP domain-containing protein 2B n=1 Tax=Pelobates fuscus TaxID=191477 RepID=UPI002FE48D3B
MEEAQAGQELRVGSSVPVLVEQVVNDTLVVSLSCGNRTYSGILLDCTKKSGLFCVPPTLFPKYDDPPTNGTSNDISEDANTTHPMSGMPLQNVDLPMASNTDQVPPLIPPPGTTPCYPPYFEGAPLPPPLWLRNSYNQWVPQPPPRTIKRTRRRMSRNRDSGRLIMSTIRLRPRQVLCEKCKNTLNSDEVKGEKQKSSNGRKHHMEDKAQSKLESDEIKSKKESIKDLVHRSPVIKISFSTPQGKGEVVKIPSRVHGSVEPFCPNQTLQNGSRDQDLPKDDSLQTPKKLVDESNGSQMASIPKLKLTKPLHSRLEVPPPKIRIRPQRTNGRKSVSTYKSELIDGIDVHQNSRRSDSHLSLLCMDECSDRRFHDASLGSSGEDDDFKGFRHTEGPNLNLVMNYRKRKADSSCASLCSNDSLDESKSSLDLNAMGYCDLIPGDDLSVSSSKDEQKTLPPLTVRLHTKSVPNCITVEGKTISVGDIVWGKVHGFPWWPARILSINLNQKEDGEPAWHEATVSWFGSPSTSCLLISKLSSFSEFFKLRFNRKKKGVYRKAITEAAKATDHVTPEIRDLLMQCET